MTGTGETMESGVGYWRDPRSEPATGRMHGCICVCVFVCEAVGRPREPAPATEQINI